MSVADILGSKAEREKTINDFGYPELVGTGIQPGTAEHVAMKFNPSTAHIQATTDVLPPKPKVLEVIPDAVNGFRIFDDDVQHVSQHRGVPVDGREGHPLLYASFTAAFRGQGTHSVAGVKINVMLGQDTKITYIEEQVFLVLLSEGHRELEAGRLKITISRREIVRNLGKAISGRAIKRVVTALNALQQSGITLKGLCGQLYLSASFQYLKHFHIDLKTEEIVAYVDADVFALYEYSGYKLLPIRAEFGSKYSVRIFDLLQQNPRFQRGEEVSIRREKLLDATGIDWTALSKKSNAQKISNDLAKASISTCKRLKGEEYVFKKV